MSWCGLGWSRTLGALADNDEYNARLRDTLRVFLQENGSYKATAERLVLHKNTVQYRVRKAEEGLKRPISQDRLHIELALLASQWLGSAVLRPAAEPATRLARPDAPARPEAPARPKPPARPEAATRPEVPTGPEAPTRSTQGYATPPRHQPAR